MDGAHSEVSYSLVEEFEQFFMSHLMNILGFFDLLFFFFFKTRKAGA